MKEVTYTVREVQARIGEVLRAVGRGYAVVITSHGRPVAELRRPRKKRSSRLDPIDRKLSQMAAQGSVILGTGGPICDLPTMPMGGAMRSFLEERRRRDDPPARRRRARRGARS